MDLRSAIRRIFDVVVTPEEIESAFRIDHRYSNEDEDLRFVSSCSVTVSPRDAIEIRGQFWKINEDGTAESAGSFFRAISRKNGVVRVDHHNIRVEPQFREREVALAHYTKAIRFYYAAGVACVFMVADEDGPVVWPQLGWQIADSGMLDRLSFLFSEELGQLGVPSESLEIDQYAPAIAAFTVVMTDGTLAYPGLKALRRLYEEVSEEIRMVAWLDQPQPTKFFRGRGILPSEDAK